MSKTKDLIIALVIGEVSAWLLLVLAKSVLTQDVYASAQAGLKILPVVFPFLCGLFMLFTHLISKKIAVFYQIGKFVLIGGFNTLIDWGVLGLCIFIFRNRGFEPGEVFFKVFAFSIVFYSLYKSISFLVAATSSFFWNKFWTFKKQTTKKIGREFLQFFIITFLGFLINVSIASGIFKIFASFAGLNQDQWGIFAAVVASAISMFWNFLGYKFFVFAAKKEPEKEKQAPIQAELPPVRPVEGSRRPAVYPGPAGRPQMRPPQHFSRRKIV